MFDLLFKNRKILPDRLLPFGFVRKGKAYAYSAGLMEGQFELLVTIDKNGRVATEVVDAESGENYILYRVAGAKGEFVGKIRDACETVLTAIAEACFEPEVFKSEDARRVIEYVRKRYEGELEFLWNRFPENAVYRRRDSNKWYAALLTVHKSKLGLPGDDRIEILDLRGRPETMGELVDGKTYFPGYHMNKKHWFTLCFNGSIPPKEIYFRIDESYSLAAK